MSRLLTLTALFMTLAAIPAALADTRHPCPEGTRHDCPESTNDTTRHQCPDEARHDCPERQ